MMSFLFIVLLSGGGGEVFDSLLHSTVEHHISQWAQRAGIESVFVEYRSYQLPALSTTDDVEIRLVSDAVVRKGYCSLPVEVVQNKKTVVRFLLPVVVRTYEHVYVTRKMLQRGERFTAENVERMFLESTQLPPDVITEGSVLENYEASRIIKERSVVTRSLCKAVPVLNPQDVVTLRVQSGSVCITTTAVAQEAGVVGDIITVQGVDVRKRYKARIVDARTVELVATKNVR